MNRKELVEYIIALMALVSMIFGANAYLAKASDLELTQMRLDQKIISDAIRDTDNRRYQLLDRNNNVADCNQIKNERDREECRKADQNLKILEKQHQILIEKTTK